MFLYLSFVQSAVQLDSFQFLSMFLLPHHPHSMFPMYVCASHKNILLKTAYGFIKILRVCCSTNIQKSRKHSAKPKFGKVY